jgi:hypothetical protein
MDERSNEGIKLDRSTLDTSEPVSVDPPAIAADNESDVESPVADAMD